MVEYESGVGDDLLQHGRSRATPDRGDRRYGRAHQIEENGTLRFDRFETDLRDHIANHPGMYAAPAMEEVDVRIPESRAIMRLSRLA